MAERPTPLLSQQNPLTYYQTALTSHMPRRGGRQRSVYMNSRTIDRPRWQCGEVDGVVRVVLVHPGRRSNPFAPFLLLPDTFIAPQVPHIFLERTVHHRESRPNLVEQVEITTSTTEQKQRQRKGKHTPSSLRKFRVRVFPRICRRLDEKLTLILQVLT